MYEMKLSVKKMCEQLDMGGKKEKSKHFYLNTV